MTLQATTPLDDPDLDVLDPVDDTPTGFLDLRRMTTAVQFNRYGPSRKVYAWYLTRLPRVRTLTEP